jgi:hypothetical protein
MSRRHTLALVTWYLLTPPTAKWTGEVLLTTSLYQNGMRIKALIPSRVVKRHRTKKRSFCSQSFQNDARMQIPIEAI